MLVVAELIVPPNTPEYAPVKVIVKPLVAVLKGVEVYFRDGCLDAVGVRIKDNDKQIAPMPSGWLRDNNNHIYWAENRHLEGAPYILTIEGYSLALDWEHLITFKFFMEVG